MSSTTFITAAAVEGSTELAGVLEAATAVDGTVRPENSALVVVVVVEVAGDVHPASTTTRAVAAARRFRIVFLLRGTCLDVRWVQRIPRSGRLAT
jgi:hypothetical protein